MSGDMKTLSLGWCFARIREDYGLEICSPASDRVPASFVRIQDEKRIEALRDALLDAFPRRNERPAFEGRFHMICGQTYNENELAESFRKAAAYDAAVERAKAISCDRPVTTETTRLVDALASGAFLKEKP